MEQVGCQDLSEDQQRKSYWKSLMKHFLSKLLGCIKIRVLALRTKSKRRHRNRQR